MATNLDPKEDYVFKRLFGDEDNALVLVALLNAVLQFAAGRLVRGVTLLNPFIPKDYVESKVSVLDIRARDDPGRLFLLEMQRLLHPFFANRVLYYWSGGHAEQLLKGDSYALLQPTYAICFLNETLFEDDVYHHRFQVQDAQHGVLLCKDLEIHLLELNKFAVPVEEVKTPEERWCYFIKHGASLDLATLPATLDDPMIRQALEILMKISQEELERQRRLERERVEHDIATWEWEIRRMREVIRGSQEATQVAQEATQAAQEQARVAQEQIQVALEQARAAQEQALAAQEQARDALEKGQRIGRIQLLRQLLAQPGTSSEALSQLTDPDLVQLEELLKRQLDGSKQANGTPPTNPM